MALTNAAVGPLEPMTAAKRLLHEWIKRYFDGADHAIDGLGTLTLPAVDVRFDQGAIATQPMERPEVRVSLRPGRVKRHRDVRGGVEGWRVEQSVAAQFYVKATERAGADGDKNRAANGVADPLHALFSSPLERMDLLNKGVTVLQARAPEAVSSGEWGARLMVVSLQLVWYRS